MKPEITFHGGEKEDGDVFIVQTRAPAGYQLTQHAHEHGHMAYLVSGVAVVEVDGVEITHMAPHAISIPAGRVHCVTALTDMVWLCIWRADLGMQDAAYKSLELVEV